MIFLIFSFLNLHYLDFFYADLCRSDVFMTLGVKLFFSLFKQHRLSSAGVKRKLGSPNGSGRNANCTGNEAVPPG